MFQSRTHTCNELRMENVGEKVKIVGWMENVREVGSNFAFVVVRDFYGTTQVVVENAEMMGIVKSINKESTISVEGVVRERASKNPKLPTGDIEVVPEKIEVLGKCRYNELPFEINRSREADETQRLKYRYLDLRNPAVKQNIILRCNVIAALRQAMMDHDLYDNVAVHYTSYAKATEDVPAIIKDAVSRGVEALFLPTYSLSALVLMTMRDMNLKTPEDLAVIGFDVSDIYQLYSTSVTHIVQPLKQLGEKSVDVLIGMIHGQPAEKVILKPEMIEGDSTKAKK